MDSVLAGEPKPTFAAAVDNEARARFKCHQRLLPFCQLASRIDTDP